MPTNTNFKPFYRIANNEITGRSRSASPGGNAGNYFLRLDWDNEDRLRGVLGTYWLPNGVDGLGQDLVTPDLYGSPGYPGGVLDYTVQAQSALSVRILPQRSRPLGPFSSRIMLNPNVQVWNSNAYNNTQDSIIQNAATTGAPPDVLNHNGNPNWPAFIRGAPGEFNWGNPIAGVGPNMTTDFPAVVSNTLTFNDYATSYYGIPDSLGDRFKSGTNLQVEGIYNFYVDTTPPYEKISLQPSEPMLTNYYCFQSLLRISEDNEDLSAVDGVTQLPVEAQEYFQQVTLAGYLQTIDTGGSADADPLFVILVLKLILMRIIKTWLCCRRILNH